MPLTTSKKFSSHLQGSIERKDSLNSLIRLPGSRLRKLYPWLGKTCEFPCSCPNVYGPYALHVIAHLYEYHVLGPESYEREWTPEQREYWNQVRWTKSQFVDFVKKMEAGA